MSRRLGAREVWELLKLLAEAEGRIYEFTVRVMADTS
jgi:hypothetical protein